MHDPSRRRERRADVISTLAPQYETTHDVTRGEAEGVVLEGTGALVLDRINRIAYAALSERCAESVVREWCALMRYTPVLFHTQRRTGLAVYHTNVVLSVGTRFAVVCSAVIAPEDRAHVLAELHKHSGRTVVDITEEQMDALCGNVLEVRGVLPTASEAPATPAAAAATATGVTLSDAAADSVTVPAPSYGRVLVMSERARAAFGPACLDVLAGCVDRIVSAPVDTIETVGGGGVRCMMAELF